ncbi:MAG: MoxR family ATPase [Clostridiales bacterium]|jgi:MoxR-like ATPase|nr:MoxR family ATPase [Eubacteriales bacterium]MDH7566238.1 MoxR family ATPase [Clostridiales bacterium]
MEDLELGNFRNFYEAVLGEVQKQVVGQEEVVREVLTAILAGGSVLMEGAPGLGKTVLVKTFARVLDLPFSRIQFTPDLMPVDITGTYIVNKTESGLAFDFQEGPIFSSLILADEINRATPKTQSAMLEAMQEKTVTVGKKTYPLPRPFFVLATQNPLEMEGTYRLPEAQLDRFLFKLKIGLPREEDIYRILDLTVSGREGREAEKRASREEILAAQRHAAQVPVAANVKKKAVALMLETHPDRTSVPAVREYVACGASPRGVQSVILGAKVRALSEGRFNVAFEDIASMARPALRHRIFLNFKAQAEKVDPDMILEEVLKKVK